MTVPPPAVPPPPSESVIAQSILAVLSLAFLLLRWPLAALFPLAILLGLDLPHYSRAVSERGFGAIPAILSDRARSMAACLAGISAGPWRRFTGGDTTMLLLLIGAALTVQLVTRAFTAGFFGHPDEPSHYVTSLMVNRFLEDPFRNPLQFAIDYYTAYPKVAVGHWPPFGYVVQALWMRFAGTGRIPVLILEGLMAGTAAFVFYRLLRPVLSRWMAMAAAALWLLNGATSRSYREVMMDIPVALLCLLALASFRAYMLRPSAAYSLGFGTFMALALITKANAVLLVLFPLFWVIFARRWELLRSRHFWLAAVPPALIAGPWYAIVGHFFFYNAAGWMGVPGAQGAAPNFQWSVWWVTGGLALLIIAVLGAAAALVRRDIDASFWGAALASCFAANTVVRAMGEPRHLLVAFAALIGCGFVLLRHAPAPLRILALAAFAFPVWRSWAPQPNPGYRQHARILEAGPPGHVLLSGPGDGPVIAAVAEKHPDPTGGRRWLRASKLMGRVRWSGLVESIRFGTTPQILEMLTRYGINQVYLDPEGFGVPAPFHDLLKRALDRSPEWELLLLGRSGREVMLFRRKTPIPSGAVSFTLPRLRREIGGDPEP